MSVPTNAARSTRRAPLVQALLPVLLPALLTAAACGRAPRAAAPVPRPAAASVRPLLHAVIPVPVSITLAPADTFVVDSTTAIVVDAGAPAGADDVATSLAGLLTPATSRSARRLAAGETPPTRSILLTAATRDATLGAEGYTLEITRDRVTIAAPQSAGLFYGVQTLRQLLPVSVEHVAALGRVLRAPGVRVVDAPRFEWRGAMLDVSRHFLSITDVKRYIDAIAFYKLNRLHLHLSDDQGWRIEITSWPELARRGGSSQVGGGAGGFYTQAEYADLVVYAGRRFVTIVPEIDMPGHTNAALASYANLNCDGVAPPLYTGTRVGFSTLCVDRDSTYMFVSDVVREIGALTPTPYFHIGGDEVEKLTPEQYRRFVERVQGIVQSHGKRMIGWGEIAPAALLPGTIVQHWRSDSSAMHVARGGSVILSPSHRLYLDMKYDSATTLGLRWAGLIDVRDAYDWEPGTLISGVPERAILGVEAPLWSETLVKREDFDFMAFPRLTAVAEIGWSPAAAREWGSFAARLGAHGPRLSAFGINFYRSPQVPWVVR